MCGVLREHDRVRSALGRTTVTDLERFANALRDSLLECSVVPAHLDKCLELLEAHRRNKAPWEALEKRFDELLEYLYLLDKNAKLSFLTYKLEARCCYNKRHAETVSNFVSLMIAGLESVRGSAVWMARQPWGAFIEFYCRRHQMRKELLMAKRRVKGCMMALSDFHSAILGARAHLLKAHLQKGSS